MVAVSHLYRLAFHLFVDFFPVQGVDMKNRDP
jgi:hypothetical protein